MPSFDGEEFEDNGYGEASRYAAHLDRGWALLEQGDTASARTSADHAAEARPDDPDAIVLLGAIALAEGEPDESLRSYDRAIELDPEYLEPYTAAAQVCLFDLDDPIRALRYCEDALELESLAPFERFDLELMAAECDLARGADRAARERLDALEDVAPLRMALELGAAPDPEHAGDEDEAEDASLEIDLETDRGVALAYLRTDPEGELLEDEERVERVSRVIQLALRLARLRTDLDQPTLAAAMMQDVAQWYPSEPDVWYLLSEATFRDGAPAVSAHAALQVLELDGTHAVPGWAPSPARLHAKVLTILRECTVPRLRALAEGEQPIAIAIRESPAAELILEGVDPRLAALALASRAGIDAADPAGATLTGLALYRRNLCRYARDAEQLEAELRFSVLDELATFLGLEDGVRASIGLPPLPPSLRGNATAAAPAPEEPDEPEGKRRSSRRRRRLS